MSAPKHTWLIFGILGLVCLSLVFFLVFNQEEPAEVSVAPAPIDESSIPSLTFASKQSPQPVTAYSISKPKLEADVQLKDRQLTDHQLAQLNELFLNSVAPYFQYEFKLEADHKAALQIFVGRMPEGLSQQDLNTITEMIQSQLKTAEAEDLALLITSLYQLEQEEARLLGSGSMPTTMAEQLKMHAQLTQMRENWLGKEFASLLYASPEVAPSSDEVEKDINQGNQGEDLQSVENEMADQEKQWEQRYQLYLQEKQLIEKAGLAEQEKQLQIEALLKHHYSTQELEAARAFDRFKSP